MERADERHDDSLGMHSRRCSCGVRRYAVGSIVGRALRRRPYAAAQEWANERAYGPEGLGQGVKNHGDAFGPKRRLKVPTMSSH